MEKVNVGDNVGSERKYCDPELNLTYKNLELISEDVLQLKHLRSLNLSFNLLKEIPSQIKNLKSLISLDFSHNQLEDLPKSLSEITQLQYINISNNKFSDVPHVLLESLWFIRVLDLSHNQIKCFTYPPGCLSNLVKLNLSHNKLTKIPNWIFSTKCFIKNLDISCNKLSFMSENFLRGNVLIKLMTKLEILNLKNCGLSSKSFQFISNMTALETLKLGNDNARINMKCCNYLDNLNLKIFEKCINLKNVHLSYCQISVLPDSFGSFQNVQYLDLQGNSLSWLPDSFCDMQSLQICNLSRNLICFLPKQFGKLTNLREIYLNNNNIVDIPDCFNLLINLEYCDLYINKLEYINSSIINLQSLKGIDLEFNCLDFHSICGDEETYNEFISKYSAMKDHYRKKISEQRLDIQMSRNDEAVHIYKESHIISSEEEYNTLLNTNNIRQGQIENWDEDWDADNLNVTSPDLEHDDFDPNVNYDSTLKWKRRTNINLYPSNFCPADNHIPSLRKYFLRKPQDITVEGQYDLN